MYDIVALGESLIDFTPSGVNELGVRLFACNPGGAPANVLAMHAKLGGKTAFIGKVGDDAFGRFLERTMADASINVSGLCKTADVPTTLAFVQLDENGDRSFSFYRKPGADICLTAEEVNLPLLRDCRLFHFGSVSLTDEPSRTATLFAAREAKRAGAMISYDPNYRPALWRSRDEAAAVMKSALEPADIIKVSREEMTLLTGETDLNRGADALARADAALVLVTGGEMGAFYRTSSCSGALPAYRVRAVDTTGSGDAFLGALLFRLRGYTKEAVAALPAERLEDIVRFASAAGGLTATARGAIPAMPTEAQIQACVQANPVRETDWR